MRGTIGMQRRALGGGLAVLAAAALAAASQGRVGVAVEPSLLGTVLADAD